MQLITKQEIANEAKDHWKMQYFKDGVWFDSNKELLYDSEYCYLCKDCLVKALDLF